MNDICLSIVRFLFVQALREKENALEALADRELTIVKFRELVQKLQDQCQELQIQLQKESVNNDSMKMSIPEMLDFKVTKNRIASPTVTKSTQIQCSVSIYISFTENVC